jgi:hypothetical protein
LVSVSQLIDRTKLLRLKVCSLTSVNKNVQDFFNPDSDEGFYQNVDDAAGGPHDEEAGEDDGVGYTLSCNFSTREDSKFRNIFAL